MLNFFLIIFPVLLHFGDNFDYFCLFVNPWEKIFIFRSFCMLSEAIFAQPLLQKTDGSNLRSILSVYGPSKL